jgi:hypothetical protein
MAVSLETITSCFTWDINKHQAAIFWLGWNSLGTLVRLSSPVGVNQRIARTQASYCCQCLTQIRVISRRCQSCSNSIFFVISNGYMHEIW